MAPLKAGARFIPGSDLPGVGRIGRRVVGVGGRAAKTADPFRLVTKGAGKLGKGAAWLGKGAGNKMMGVLGEELGKAAAFLGKLGGGGKAKFVAVVGGAIGLGKLNEKTETLWAAPGEPTLMNDEGQTMEFDPTDAQKAAGYTGLCVDFNYLYSQQCPMAAASPTLVSLVGCPSKMYMLFFCGMQLQRTGGDMDSISLDFGSFVYPRTLIDATPDTTGSGRSAPATLCYDPIDCDNKCAKFNQRSREGGQRRSPACATCQLPCPSNLMTTIKDAVMAIRADVIQAVRLVVICFAKGGPGKCMCALARTLEPHWLTLETDKERRCESGNALMNIIDEIKDHVLSAIGSWFENAFSFLIPSGSSRPGIDWGDYYRSKCQDGLRHRADVLLCQSSRDMREQEHHG